MNLDHLQRLVLDALVFLMGVNVVVWTVLLVHGPRNSVGHDVVATLLALACGYFTMKCWQDLSKQG